MESDSHNRFRQEPHISNVLVIEDEPIALQVISRILRSKSFTVLEATNAAGALQIVQNHADNLDLLIADILLPDKSGVQIAVELFKLRRMPVLFISGTPFGGWRTQDLLNLQLLPRNAWEFLQKPFQPPELEQNIRQLLARANAHAAVRSVAATGTGETAQAILDPGGNSASDPVIRDTVADLLREIRWSADGTWLNPAEFDPAPQSARARGYAPEFSLCEEKMRLTQEFLFAIHELTDLHSQQTRALIKGDPDFGRFDLRIHLATERKEEAKYALIRHMESHHCQEG